MAYALSALSGALMIVGIWLWTACIDMPVAEHDKKMEMKLDKILAEVSAAKSAALSNGCKLDILLSIATNLNNDVIK